MLAIIRSADFYGAVGMESNTEINGVKICVGDIIHVAKGSNNNECTNVVAVFGNNIGVMGLGSTPLSQLNILKIVQSHTVLKHGDRLYGSYFDVKSMT